MRSQLLILSWSILFTLSACSKKVAIKDEGPSTPPLRPITYRLTENFEAATKTGYAAADLDLLTGSWNFNDALLGTLATDRKEGLKSVRLRTGSINMNFDIAGLKMLYVYHSKFGSDANTTWKLLMSVDGGAVYSQVGADVVEDNTALELDSFAITSTSKVRFKIVNTSTSRINIDNITFRGEGDPGIIVGTPDTGVDEGLPTGTPTAARDVVPGPDAPPLTGENGNIFLGNPSDAQSNVVFADNYLIDHKYFVESYSSTRAIPNWVSWHLDSTNLGTAPRQDNFAAWSGLPAGWFQVQSNSYSYSTYGFDRGHNCPSADRTSSVEANSSTFLMTNMIPQSSANNQGVWSNFENYLRSQVLSKNEVYIIMGNYGTGGTSAMGTFSKINNVTVPSNIWKVAVIIPAGSNDLNRINAETRVIAINTPNSNTVSADWRQYIVTVRAIEAETKLNILSALPQNIQDLIENKKDQGN